MIMTERPTIERLPINDEFARPADSAAIQRAAEALRTHGFDAQIVGDGEAARELLLSLIADGAEVGEGASKTMDQIGVTEIIEKGGHYDAIRPRTRSMDRATQMREIRKLVAAPDVQLGGMALPEVAQAEHHAAGRAAVTEDGQLVLASASGSQLGPISSGAGRVILVVGSQKVVPDLETAFRRVEEYSYPMVDAMAQEAYGRHSAINKLLVLNGEPVHGRSTVILVREPVGV